MSTCPANTVRRRTAGTIDTAFYAQRAERIRRLVLRTIVLKAALAGVSVTRKNAILVRDHARLPGWRQIAGPLGLHRAP